MRSSPLARAAMVLAAVAAASLSVVTPAGAAPDRGSSPDAAAAATAHLHAALQRDLGLTAEQAVALAERQQRALDQHDQLSDTLGDTYGGAWFDAASGVLTVAVTDERAAAKVKAVGATPELVSRSKVQLDGIKAELDATVRVDRATLADATTWSVDERTNQVVVTVLPGAAAKVTAVVAKHGDAVRIVESALRPETTADYLDGGDPYNGCSVGFNVTRGGVGHFLTAGHCGTAGTMASSGGVNIGPFVESWFPGDDDALVRNDNPGYWIQGPWVYAYSGDPNAVYNINGYRDSPTGVGVCKSGRTTGLTCGTITGKNETVNYAQGAVYQLTRHNACVEPGDSGGSNFSWDGAGRNYAEGMTSGASLYGGRCGAAVGQPTNSWYQPVAESIGWYGVALMTAP